MKQRIIVSLLLLCVLTVLPAQELDKGIAYLKAHNPDRALPLFFAETQKPDGNTKAYLYLAVACIQLQKYSDAVTWLNKGKTLDPTDSYLYSYNLGNAYYMQGSYELALNAFTAATTENQYYAPAFLNKANTEMQLGKQDQALISYKNYLSLEPSSPQRPSIERMIGILQGEADAKQAEALRAEAEAKAQAEREAALLNQVNNDLSTADKAKTLSAGSEDTIDYNEEEGNLE